MIVNQKYHLPMNHRYNHKVSSLLDHVEGPEYEFL